MRVQERHRSQTAQASWTEVEHRAGPRHPQQQRHREDADNRWEQTHRKAATIPRKDHEMCPAGVRNPHGHFVKKIKQKIVHAVHAIAVSPSREKLKRREQVSGSLSLSPHTAQMASGARKRDEAARYDRRRHLAMEAKGTADGQAARSLRS